MKAGFGCGNLKASRLHASGFHHTIPGLRKVRIKQSTQKAMLILFFDRHGPVFKQWFPNGLGITGARYLQVMKSLKEAVRCRRPTHRDDWALLHDNAPAHIHRDVVCWLQENRIERVPHPGYSPDLSPCDFWVFAELKKMVAGTRHHSLQDMMTAVDAAIQSIQPAKWAAAMERYPECLRKCIRAGGAYFERG